MLLKIKYFVDGEQLVQDIKSLHLALDYMLTVSALTKLIMNKKNL